MTKTMSVEAVLARLGKNDGWKAIEYVARTADPTVLDDALRSTVNPVEAVALVNTLAQARRPTPIGGLVQRLSDPDPTIRDAAADALAKVGDPEALPGLVNRYKVERRVGIRVSLVVAIGALGDVHVVPLLASVLKNEDAMLRRVSAWGLGHIGGARAAEALAEARSKETEPMVVDAINDALSKIAHEAK